MQVKIVVRVSMSDKKSRSKALKICVGIWGVESAALSGAEKDQVVVVGESIDAVELTRQLRKGVAHAELVSVGEDKKEDTNKPAAAVVTPANATPVVWSYLPHYVGYNSYPIYESSSSDSCTIM
ncbi:heavy metal-associated isoprenylated plant protein 16-like [Salvia splendens]|nr:heavy metal-associated isoprenylated plant protein 16-like [Salvia splendens]